MGINSTEVSYGFGQLGSAYTDIAQTIVPPKDHVIIAITFTEDTTFQTLGILDGGSKLGMGNTHFVSTEDTQTLDTDWGAVTDAADDDGKVVTTSHTFPKGVTLYGMYDFVELNSGACVCYVAPRPDYRSRA